MALQSKICINCIFPCECSVGSIFYFVQIKLCIFIWGNYDKASVRSFRKIRISVCTASEHLRQDLLTFPVVTCTVLAFYSLCTLVQSSTHRKLTSLFWFVRIFTIRVCGYVIISVESVCLSVCLCVCLSVHLSVCLSVCVSVQMITFEPLKIGTSFLVHTYIFIISRSSLSTKVIGSRSRSND